MPNNGHGLTDRARIVGGLNALNQRVITGKPLPKLEWSFDERRRVTCELNVDERRAAQPRAGLDGDGGDARLPRSKWTATDAAAADDAVHLTSCRAGRGLRGAAWRSRVFTKGPTSEFRSAPTCGSFPAHGGGGGGK